MKGVWLVMVWVRSPVYVYKRGEMFYFSRAVPSDLQHRFDKRKKAVIVLIDYGGCGPLVRKPMPFLALEHLSRPLHGHHRSGLDDSKALRSGAGRLQHQNGQASGYCRPHYRLFEHGHERLWVESEMNLANRAFLFI
jgi:hypothetical protein